MRAWCLRSSASGRPTCRPKGSTRSGASSTAKTWPRRALDAPAGTARRAQRRGGAYHGPRSQGAMPAGSGRGRVQPAHRVAWKTKQAVEFATLDGCLVQWQPIDEAPGCVSLATDAHVPCLSIYRKYQIVLISIGRLNADSRLDREKCAVASRAGDRGVGPCQCTVLAWLIWCCFARQAFCRSVMDGCHSWTVPPMAAVLACKKCHFLHINNRPIQSI